MPSRLSGSNFESIYASDRVEETNSFREPQKVTGSDTFGTPRLIDARLYRGHFSVRLAHSIMGKRRRNGFSKKAERRQIQADIEVKIQNASASIANGTFKFLSEAAEHFDVEYSTFRRRHIGETQTRSNAHQKQMILNDSQETTLCEWIKYLGMTGHPLSSRQLRVKVVGITNTTNARESEPGQVPFNSLPSRNWVYSFLTRNPCVVLKRPTGLDPLRAACFNSTVVKDHFQVLAKFLTDYDIPWDNVYNMDEKGIQLGGGRKMDNTKFLYSQAQHTRVVVQSASLELVTVIECVGALGSHLKPAFVFCGKNVLQDGYFEEEGVL